MKITDSGHRRVFDTGAHRDRAEGKGAFNQLPWHGLEALAKVYELGAEKYTANNWKLGMPVSEFLNSGMRHMVKACQGWTDEPHIAMAAWNCLCAIETQAMVRAGQLPPELDDVDDWLTNEGVRVAMAKVKAANERKINGKAES